MMSDLTQDSDAVDYDDISTQFRRLRFVFGLKDFKVLSSRHKNYHVMVELTQPISDLKERILLQSA